VGPRIKGDPLPWLPDAETMATQPCKRGCCWTPFGHAGTVATCPCHPVEQVARG
jgi:hypothetical protein